MKALILVGGYGTRLRPLTLSVPKPLIQFCNKSIIEHQISALVKAGVDHVILAVAYKTQDIIEAMEKLEQKFNIRISYSREDVPLGTAGPIKLAEQLLVEGSDPSDPFFVCNSDVICEFPLKEMLEFHRAHKGEGTVLVTRVEDPSSFGVVVSDADGKVQKFVEKPTQFQGDQINAGCYILERSVFNRLELRPTSIEKELFPAIAADGSLYCFNLEGYWADIGKPEDFLRGTALYLDHQASLKKHESSTNGDECNSKCFEGVEIIGNVLIHPTVKIGRGSRIGPNVTIGANCVIGEGVRISYSAMMEGVQIQGQSYIRQSILGWHSRIGRWVRIEGLSVVGADVSISDESLINQAIILPHKEINTSIREPGKIIM